MILFEILVPCQTNEGRPIRTRQHRVWDEKVREITGGLTVMPPVTNGQWLSSDGQLFKERMIPVRIVAGFTQMEKIADMTAEFYGQKAVMFYEISRKVVIREYTPEVS